MNSYTIHDMVPGLTESFTVTVTEEMMQQFYAITGDCSPIHMDASYAAGRGFPGRVVYGMLGASFFPRWPVCICPVSTAFCTAWKANLPPRYLWAIRLPSPAR